MASVKSLIEAQCGTQAPLVSLSNNFGQSNALFPTSSESVPFTSKADQMAQDYLRNVSADTNLPNTFKMSTLLRQCKPSSSKESNKKVKTSQQNRLENSALLSQWSKEYENRMGQVYIPLKDWASAYTDAQSVKLTPTLDEAWNQAVIHPLAVSASLDANSHNKLDQVWASDFLEKFDSMALQNGQAVITDSRRQATNTWIDEFLGRQDGMVDMDYKELNDDAYEIFSRYEDEWRNAELSTMNGSQYVFNCQNAFINEADPLNKAKDFFLQGNISDAVLCYETALQRNPTDAETWCSLGLCHAENEQDVEAIAAYHRSLELEPLNRRTLLASAVSLANEGADTAAMRHLDQWIDQFTNGGNQNSKNFVDDAFVVDESWTRRLEEKFLAAVSQPNLSIDHVAELQNAIGIFYNLTQNYEKAVDAMRISISIHPEDSVLWNRLGASLANNDRSPEAIGAYRKALEIFPAYVRARYNLGVSCMNMSAYNDAIGHFLSALKLQKSRQNTQIWSKLRSCVLRISSRTTNPTSSIDSTMESSSWVDTALDAVEAHDLNTMLRIYETAARS